MFCFTDHSPWLWWRGVSFHDAVSRHVGQSRRLLIWSCPVLCPLTIIGRILGAGPRRHNSGSTDSIFCCYEIQAVLKRLEKPRSAAIMASCCFLATWQALTRLDPGPNLVKACHVATLTVYFLYWPTPSCLVRLPIYIYRSQRIVKVHWPVRLQQCLKSKWQT